MQLALPCPYLPQYSYLMFSLVDAPLDENSTLNDVYVRVMNNTDCAQIYGDSLITRDVMCTSGANGKGACGGDYGGPLVLRRFSNDEDMLV